MPHYTDTIESSFSFKGTCVESNLSSLKDNRTGDIWVASDTGRVFLWAGTSWDCIEEEKKSDSSPEGKIRTSCKYCGAPLHTHNNPGYAEVVKCEYCNKTNSSWILTIDPDFK